MHKYFSSLCLQLRYCCPCLAKVNTLSQLRVHVGETTQAMDTEKHEHIGDCHCYKFTML